MGNCTHPYTPFRTSAETAEMISAVSAEVRRPPSLLDSLSRPPRKEDRALARDELLTVPEVVRELQISRATFYRWLATGKGPKTLKLPGGTIRIRRSALDRFLTDCSALA